MRLRPWIPAAFLLAPLCLAIPGGEPTFELRAGAERVISDAVSNLDSPQYETRERALRRLISLGPMALPALEKARTSRDAEVHTRAKIAIRKITERAQPRAIRNERDFALVIRYGLLPGRDLRPGTNRFTALALDPGAAARAGATVAAEIESRPIPHRRVVALLTDLGHADAAPYLAELLTRGYPLASTLHLAARGLLRFAGPEVLPELRSAAGPDREPIARKLALRVLSIKGEAEDLPILLLATTDPEAEVRAAGARAAGMLGGGRAVPALTGLIADRDPVVRIAAIETLERIPDAAMRDLAIDLLDDPAEGVRTAALTTLSRRGTAGDLPAIMPLLGDPDDSVRAAAVTATARLGRPGEAARRGLPDPSPRVRRASILATLALPLEDRRELLSGISAETDPYLASLIRHVVRTN